MLRTLYLFASAKRKSGLAGALARACTGVRPCVTEEWDILQGGHNHDLTKRATQRKLMKRVARGDFDLIAASPPVQHILPSTGERRRRAGSGAEC